MQTIKTVVAAMLLIASLVGCGGGDGNSSPSTRTSAEGFWNGSTASRSLLTGAVLDDGTYYVMYSPQGNSSVIAGYIQGNGTSNNGSFTSDNALDFNFQGLGVLAAKLSASYTEKQSFTGKLTYSNGTFSTFSSSYDSKYEEVPSLSGLAGTFTGQAASPTGSENGTFSISANGVLSGIGGAHGCMATGTVTPRTRGNVFNVSLTFGGAPCSRPGQTLAGILYYNSSAKSVYAAAQNDARNEGFMLVGVKP